MTLDWISPADRLQKLPPYVFARLDELKARAREQGLDLIDLGMGNPDGATPQPVVEAAIAAIQNPANHGYPPFEGTASFRRTITKWYSRRYNVELDPEGEALPLLGSKEGLAHFAIAYINPGDLVLVPSPAYPVLFRGPIIAGAKVHNIILKPENDWVIDLGSIPDSVAEQAKILYFNYPSNPTGATAPREFYKDIVAFAHKHQILLVHDLCYAELAFDGYQPTSLLEIPGGKEIGVEFHTMSKTYNMAGWRVGFVVGNSRIIQGLRTLKTNLDYGIFSALQAAAETALQLPDSYLHEVQERYRTRRDFMVAGLAELGWNIPKPLAAMYLWVPCTQGMSSTDFALNVLQQTGVVVTPGNAFGPGGEGYVRVSLIADCDRLGEALRRLKQANIRY
ncbi:MAG: aspartate aminotransferase [Microcoleus sp. PH2017_29_MFU_D_A]|uniref:aspartate aminotransferase n=1 Tax=unclassified Microcoleus TaxID=2642155 RepID=UPI001D4717D3|nr:MULTISPECIES: aspartate aminotransferase [unclassified Microcoleus]MCC3416802.1 aspartate aminotransferase [Microcoleus sp. PH2017_07_MST_O_A]MCC3432333.1 aspartate aminotransferase [Microcoleus sp. PH2017_04_SCI_O_A]MCC3442049.1 aspartate aminotransferase [Microcoleus sp. PH2017_03_ELD_O_A]MCC3464465.1 aspartate aminotransferase [Microcoleus sp. PH2017_06_SFM_O_A]MCC3502794.1 aspartate aminotransferase [Microcoleus sp. PH2017_19_SFW_U_A]MCC3509827.1 aspartate aminotransferase [Microcoleus